VVTDRDEPLVNVLTPVYNGGRYLRQCIESVIAQTHQNWRYTIVNNRSTDDSRDIAEHFARLDQRIRVHDNPGFLPIIDNHNLAFSLLAEASDYCKPLMADDWLHPECLETMLSAALERPSIGLVCATAITAANLVMFKKLPATDEPVTILTGRQACRISLLEDRYFFGSPTTMLIRADLIRKRTPFYNPVNLHADEESCYDILRESDFAFVHRVLAFIRLHEHSQTTAVRKLGTMQSSRTYALTQYGRIYLSEAEFEQRLHHRLHQYYQHLAVAALHLPGAHYWEYHRKMLALIGAPLSRLRVAVAVLVYVARRAMCPLSLLRSVAERLRTVLRGAHSQ
jgi:glycosyltransferase involved in cell wall biosynthesis